MNPIYQTPSVSFINMDTKQPITHPEGDYTEFNTKLKRLASLVEKHQPQQPIVFLYHPPAERNPVKNNELIGKTTMMETIFSLSKPSGLPMHSFIIPAVGQGSEITSCTKLKDFNDIGTHISTLEGLVDSVISSLEYEYSEHPLHYNKQVEFRQAKYIDNHQAFSFWPTSTPFGEYPLSKPLFDNLIEQLKETKKPFQICIDFVQDWKEQYSSIGTQPKEYGIDVIVVVGEKQFPNMHIHCTKQELEILEKHHDSLDASLQPAFEALNNNFASYYSPTNKKPKI